MFKYPIFANIMNIIKITKENLKFLNFKFFYIINSDNTIIITKFCLIKIINLFYFDDEEETGQNN